MSAWARTIPSLRLPTAKSRSATASSAANTCILCRHLRKLRNRNGQKGTVPIRGGPDEILGSRPQKGEGEPRRGSPLFLCLLPELSRAASRRGHEEKSDVRENAETAAEAGFPGRRARACRCDCRRSDRAQSRGCS